MLRSPGQVPPEDGGVRGWGLRHGTFHTAFLGKQPQNAFLQTRQQSGKEEQVFRKKAADPRPCPGATDLPLCRPPGWSAVRSPQGVSRADRRLSI